MSGRIESGDSNEGVIVEYDAECNRLWLGAIFQGKFTVKSINATLPEFLHGLGIKAETMPAVMEAMRKMETDEVNAEKQL